MTAPRPRRVTFLIRDLNIGGAQRQLIELASAMDRSTWKVHVLTFYDDGPLAPDLIARGVALESLAKRGRWDILGFWFRLLRATKRNRPDILHGYMGTENIFATTMKPFFPRLLVVWALRSSEMDASKYERVGSLLAAIARRLVRHADLIISNSSASVTYHASAGFPAERMVVVPNGIDSQRFAPDPQARTEVRQEWSIDEEQLLIGIIGRLDPKKDYPTFLRAAARVAAARDDVRFVCVGPGPEAYRNELTGLTSELGLGDRLVWAGGRLDMPRVYNALDLLVSSSAFGEGFPNVVAEAMSTGVPCVVSDTGDSTVVVGPAGWVCRPKDIDDLARAIGSAIESRDGLVTRGKQARERIVTEFSVERLALTTSARLADLITKAGGGSSAQT